MGELSSLVSESWSQDLAVKLQVVYLKKMMTNPRSCRFPYLTLTGRSSDSGILKYHSRNTVGYQKALESKLLKVCRL